MAEASAELVRHLPHLRRYARALLGSQSRGDRYVRACLEAYLAEPAGVERNPDKRIALFSLFHDVCVVIDPESDADVPPESDEMPAVRGVNQLPPRRRQVLLLVSLEGFSFEEVSRILGMTDREVRIELDQARAEMASLAGVRVLIIEDEPLIAEDIADLVTGWGHQVVGQAVREEDALRIAIERKPELILADIQLKGGGNGIRAVQEILRTSNVPVVFITGFPERLLTGEQLEPVFLISKPFEPDVLKTAIGQALTIQPPHAMN